MAPELSIRRPSSEDLPRILDLIKLSLGESRIPRDQRYWHWKHQANPFGPSACLIAEVDGQIVGVRAFLRWSWSCNGTEVSAVRAVDTAVHPDWRRVGIFSRLTLALLEELRQEGVSFVFNTPNHHSLPGYEKMGWKRVRRVPLSFRPLRPWRCLRALTARCSTDDVNADPSDGATMEHLLQQPELPRLLSTAHRANGCYETPRSAEYLRWRYLKVPGFTYAARWIFQGDDGAVAIYRIRRRRGVDQLLLSEFVVSPTNRGTMLGARMIRDLTRQIDAELMVACVSKRTPESAALHSSTGFVRVPSSGPVFTVRLINGRPDLPNPLCWASWRCAIGDLEIF